MIYLAGVDRAVDTGDTYFNEIQKSPITARVDAHRRLTDRNAIRNHELFNGQPLKARVEYSRWIVDCPNCGGAEFAFEDKRFICSQCNNGDVDGKINSIILALEKAGIIADN